MLFFELPAVRSPGPPAPLPGESAGPRPCRVALTKTAPCRSARRKPKAKESL